MRTEFYYPSYGQGQIHGCRWEPEGKPKAVLQIVHGIAEHIARYDDFANFMTAQGFLVVAEDHMGHGGSIGEADFPGYFEGGWFKAVADCHRLLSDTRKEFPDIPYVLLGHSMGSFLVRTMLMKYPRAGLSAAIISGTAWMSQAVLNAGIATASMVCKVQCTQSYNKMVNALMFGSYNKKIKDSRTAYDWLTRDPAIVDAYMADPLCGFAVTAGLARDMLKGMRCNQKPENLKKMNKALPVLFLSGSEDPVGDYGKGVKRTHAEFQKVGMKRVDIRLYPEGRHEMLNELNKEEVFSDILQWLQTRHVID